MVTAILRKKSFLVLIFGLFLNFNAGAYVVSFYVIETGLPDDRNEVRHSLLWENAFLDVFFEAGYIVSNAPILRLERIPADILHIIDVDEAISGGVDVMVIARLDYASGSQIPGEVLLFVYRTVRQEKVLERRIPGRARDIEDIKNFVRALIPYVG